MLHTILSLLLLVATPLVATTNQTNKSEKSMHNEISSDQLKSWYDQNKTMIVLDARTKPYFDGTLLPNAKWLSAESTEEEIKAAIPSKNSLVVVYCYGVGCPASAWLYDKLVSMGYTNIYEYHGGLQDWLQKGFPTTKQ